MTALFFQDTYKKWQEKWPTRLSTNEVTRAKGNVKKALAVKQKASDEVRTSNENLLPRHAYRHPSK